MIYMLCVFTCIYIFLYVFHASGGLRMMLEDANRRIREQVHCVHYDVYI